MSSDGWKVGQKVRTPKGLGKVIAVRNDGTAVYSIFKNSKGELEQGFHGSLPAYRIFKNNGNSFDINIVEDDDTDVSDITLEAYLADEVEYETKPCMHCGKTTVMKLDRESVEAWKNGEFIQEAFPELNKGSRELIVSGIHPECWNAMFGDED